MIESIVQAAVKSFKIARAVKSLMKLISAVRSEFFMGRICSNSNTIYKYFKIGNENLKKLFIHKNDLRKIAYKIIKK
jgi:hypothetical protein